MAEPVTIQELSEAIYQMVKEVQGVKKLKATDLTKSMIERFGPERCTKEACKEAIRGLMDSGRCVYTYFGGSFIELPPKEGSTA